ALRSNAIHRRVQAAATSVKTDDQDQSSTTTTNEKSKTIVQLPYQAI
ncbi:unnamed protein product, partial [Rotaria sp. Silwood2]